MFAIRYFGDECGSCMPSYWRTSSGLCLRQFVNGKTLYELQEAPSTGDSAGARKLSLAQIIGIAAGEKQPTCSWHIPNRTSVCLHHNLDHNSEVSTIYMFLMQ